MRDLHRGRFSCFLSRIPYFRLWSAFGQTGIGNTKLHYQKPDPVPHFWSTCSFEAKPTNCRTNVFLFELSSSTFETFHLPTFHQSRAIGEPWEAYGDPSHFACRYSCFFLAIWNFVRSSLQSAVSFNRPLIRCLLDRSHQSHRNLSASSVLIGKNIDFSLKGKSQNDVAATSEFVSSAWYEASTFRSRKAVLRP